MKRDTRSAYRSRTKATEAAIDAGLAETKTHAEQERNAAIEAFHAKNQPIPYTAEQLANARFIRTELGWHKVVRVNAKTVSVESGYSWLDRINIAKIVEVR